ncbi:MAG: hypothetical protein J6K55_04055 [Clostridia bacterium]|nr:hypothetical protein [Clostridia bacterium]
MTYGKSMPISVRIENKGADLNGTIGINIYYSRTAYNRYDTDLQLAQGAVKDLLIPVAVYSKQEKFTVELLEDGEVICAVSAEPELVVNPDSMLIGVLSPEPQNLAYMNINMETDELLRSEYMQVIPLTETTFPGEDELINSFGMIVVDGFDVSLLSEAQQETLFKWLESGHILVVGGGAQAGTVWPYFNTYTGLEAGQVTNRPDFSSSILDYLAITAETVNQDILICEGIGGEALITDEDQPVVWRSSAGDGVIYTTAFGLGTKPISTWKVMNTFWQRLLLKDNPRLYENSFSNRNNGYNGMAYVPQNIPMENTSGMALLIIAVCAFLAVSWIAAYFIVRRMDRRQYLWAILPLTTAVCTILVLLIAKSCGLNQPIVLSVTGIRQDADNNLSSTNALTLATAESGEHLITAPDRTLVPYNDGYYDYIDEEKDAEPTQLNYRYVQGAHNGIGVNFTSPWNRQILMIDDVPVPEGGIESSLWREEDGLHGYVINHTGVNLSEGVILSRLGYCSVPALGVEERYDFTLLSAEFADLQKPVYEDGCMYESRAGGYSDATEMVNEYLYKVSHLKEGETVSYEDPVKNLKSRLMQEIVSEDYRQQNGYFRTMFHYVALCEEFPTDPVYIDGEEVGRRSNWAVFSTVLEYSGVGSTGIIYHVPGMDEAVRCLIDNDGNPYMDHAISVTGRDYHRLNENPAFVFDLSELGSMDVSRLILYSDVYLRYVHMYLYDGENWIEQKLSEEIEDPGRFISADGKVYVQFRPDVSADDYSEVCTPTMLLEGRVK